MIDFVESGEYFQVELFGAYNIDRAKRMLRHSPRAVSTISVPFWKDFADGQGWAAIPTSGDPAIDCSIPVIVATIDQCKGSYLLVDGWHRLYKAAGENRRTLPAFILTQAETKEIFEVSWNGLA